MRVITFSQTVVLALALAAALPGSAAAQANKPVLAPQVGHSYETTSAVFSPDGRFVVSGGWDNMLVLWDVATGVELRRFVGHGNWVTSVAYSPDGLTIASTAVDGTVRLWDAKTAAPRATIPVGTAKVWSVAFSPDGRRFATAGDNGAALWDATTGMRVTDLVKGVAWAVAFSPDGSRIATSGSGSSTALWDAATGKQVGVQDGAVRSLAFSPDGRRLAQAFSNGTLRVVDVGKPSPTASLQADKGQLKSVAFSPDGRRLASSGEDGTAKLWDAVAGKPLATLSGHEGTVNSVAFSPDGRLVVTTGKDRKVKLWDAATFAERASLEGHSTCVWSVACSADGRSIVTGALDRKVKLWDTATGERTAVFGDHERAVLSVAVSPDGRLIASGGADETAVVRETATGKVVARIRAAWGPVNSVAFSPDGLLLATGSGGAGRYASSASGAAVWDVETGERRKWLVGHSGAIRAVAFSRDGRQVATASSDKTARIWDAATSRESKVLAGHAGTVTSVAFSPDGRTIATASEDRTVKLWDAATGTPRATLNGHSDAVYQVAFSPDGRQVVTASEDRTAKLWDAATGAVRTTLSGHGSAVFSVAFMAGGRRVVTGGYDSTTRIWDAPSGRELCRLLTFDDGTWVAIDPEGRFDTNDLESSRWLYWLMPDAPDVPLPLEIFARDYYEPRLLGRILAGESFVPVRDLTKLNRVQPDVHIFAVVPQDNGRVNVRVRVVPKPQTAAYDLRLFRDGQLVGYAPATDGPVRAGARDGSAILTFSNVRLPRSTGRKSVEFTAYAFNEDRVRSRVARKSLPLTAGRAEAKGRAFVVSVGVNVYDQPALNLRFAANDARQIQRLVAERLERTGRFAEVVPVTLVSDASGALATKANIRTVLDVLSGRRVAADVLARIPNGGRLRAAGPQDLVLITFSGHGYADGRGRFFLVPSDVGAAPIDGVRGGEADVPEELVRRSISSDELALWLRDVDAGDMALVVDACQSAASVQSEGFKPGPMGSRGLGQLAYDKGMLVLAATQSDSVALEKEQLQQGLLSYVLTREGLEAGEADFKPKDGRITLAEWLAYGVERVPSLYEELKAGAVRPSAGTRPRLLLQPADTSDAALRKVQRPSLFDFSRRRADAVLAGTQ